MTARLVYVWGLRGPAAQIWFGDQSGVGGKEPFTFKQGELRPGDEKLSFDVLQRLYPPPISKEKTDGKNNPI